MNVNLKEIFYFMGLTQSDGGFYVLVRGVEPVFKPVFKLASLTNTNTLDQSIDFLKRIGVYSGYEEGVPSDPEIGEAGRAPSIRVQSVEGIKKIISLYQDAWFKVTGVETPLLANKQRDLKLLALTYSNITFSKEEKIDIRHSFHKESYIDQDLPTNVQTKSRAEHEEIFNIVGKSAGSAKNIIENVEKTLKPTDPAKIPCDFWLGLLDGDGGFHVACHAEKNDKNEYISYLSFSIYVTLTLELGSKSVFTDFEKALGLKPLRINDFRKTTGKNAYQVQIRDAKEVKKIIKFIDDCGGLRGDTKRSDFELMKETQNLREQGVLYKSFSGDRAYQHGIMDKLLFKIFKVGQKPRKGPKRSLTYESAMDIVKRLYK
uniref:Homing endonuclease LAGLIDADG domain-containing protein n=1 Tax=Dunaliella tertiolecta TaxID=3047 RepID=A0A6S8IYN6_DUNTE|mmetsp:Transcript_12365/g.33742  ORF Transcript_12365/g.33742 Transcript_12365/m.33742 type:complete len:374 (+) Transcript_12365:334-1455(+)